MQTVTRHHRPSISQREEVVLSISNTPVMDVNRLENDPNVQVITNPSLSCNYMALISSMSMALPAPTILTRSSM